MARPMINRNTDTSVPEVLLPIGLYTIYSVLNRGNHSYYMLFQRKGNRGSAVGIQDGRGVGVRVAVGAKSSPLYVVQTDSGAHLASSLLGTRGSFPW
jgi:hypothetical protein